MSAADSDDPAVPYTSDVWMSVSADLSQWSLVTNNVSWGPRGDYGLAASDTTLLVTGGRFKASGSFGRLYHDVWSSTNGRDWSLVTNTPGWTARYGHMASHFNGRYFLLGGLVPFPVSEVWLSTDGVSWDAKTGPQWAPRAYAAVAVFDGRLWMAGGTNLLKQFNDVWSTTDGSVWLSPYTAPWQARDSAAMVVAEGVLWLMGGRTTVQVGHGDGDGAQLANTSIINTFATDVWRSDSAGRQWELVESAARYGGRAGAGAVVVPSQPSTVFVIGGWYSSGSGNDPVPVADVWQSTANLLCENASVVCSGHGTCTPSTSAGGAGMTSQSGSADGSGHTGSSPQMASFSVGYQYSSSSVLPPLPINCTCDVGYMSSRCADRVCSSKTCVHGTCTQVNTSGVGDDTPDSLTLSPVTGQVYQPHEECVCTDPSKWSGPRCDTAVCAPGCDPVHGACPGQPGVCICVKGWAGVGCTIEIGWLADVGSWVSGHVQESFLSVTIIGMVSAFASVCWVNISIGRKPGGSKLSRGGGGQYSSSGSEGSSSGQSSGSGSDSNISDVEGQQPSGGSRRLFASAFSRGADLDGLRGKLLHPHSSPASVSRHGEAVSFHGGYGSMARSSSTGPAAALSAFPSSARRPGNDTSSALSAVTSVASGGGRGGGKKRVRFGALQVQHFSTDETPLLVSAAIQAQQLAAMQQLQSGQAVA